MITNIHRKKGTRPIEAHEWFRDPEEDRMTPDEAVVFMDRWIAGTNAHAPGGH